MMQKQFEVVGHQQPLAWHPMWRVFNHGALGFVLVGESQTLWLDCEQFPGIEFIDGERNALEILDLLNQQPNKISHGARFLFQLNQLYQAKAVVSRQDEVFQQYIVADESHQLAWLQTEGEVKVASLSQNCLDWQFAFAEACSDGCVDSKQSAQELLVLLVDDLLDHRVLKVSETCDRMILIKVSGNNFAITPVFDDYTLVTEFIERLRQNQPVRCCFELAYPEQVGLMPILKERKPFDIQFAGLLKQVLTQQLCAQGLAHLAIITPNWQNIDASAVERHPIMLSASDCLPFAEQLKQPIRLTECLSVFDKDGGSRSLTPDQTVAKLEPLISSVTGVINYVNTLDSFADNPIKIFGTAFFKTPTKRQLQRIDNESFSQACLGKGVSPIQSKASALCETIERYNAHYRNDVDGRLARYSELSQHHRCVGYSELLPYSDKQLRLFADANHPESQRKQAALVYDDSEVRWLPTWSLRDEQQVWLPLSVCFSQVPFEDEKFGRWSSNGCAAGNRIEEAILQALFELIERDATAIWWYNRLTRPAFDLSRLDADNFAVLEKSISHSHDFWVLDITTDVGIPAMVAIGQHKDNQGYIMGMGCHIQPELAAQRALTELCQLIPIRDQNGAPFDFDVIVDGPHMRADAEQASFALKDDFIDKDIKHQVEYVVSRLSRLGLNTLVLDYSRGFIPLKTAKVFVPGLTHIWPQLGNHRLYQAPVDMGLVQKALTESQINPHALYI